MTYEVTLNFVMNPDHGRDRKAIACDARERLGFARALSRFDADRCSKQIEKLTADAYALLDALADAEDGQQIEGFGSPGSESMANYASTLRLLMEAEAQHEYVGRQSVDAFATVLFEEIERQAEALKGAPASDGEDETKEEVPAHP